MFCKRMEIWRIPWFWLRFRYGYMWLCSFNRPQLTSAGKLWLWLFWRNNYNQTFEVLKQKPKCQMLFFRIAGICNPGHIQKGMYTYIKIYIYSFIWCFECKASPIQARCQIRWNFFSSEIQWLELFTEKDSPTKNVRKRYTKKTTSICSIKLTL